MFLMDRRDLLAGFTAFLGVPLVAPLSNAMAANAMVPGMPNGFTASAPLFTPDQQALVAAVSERIVPTTDTPGAITAGVPAFMEMMLMDWYAPKDRNDFLAGLKTLDNISRTQHGKPLAAMSDGQQDAILSAAMKGGMQGLSHDFFEHCRQLVLLGYYTSEAGATVERVYLPLPGHYDGAYPYAKVRRIFSS
jgi:hypothetical protein